jgi:leucyl aminopeptidase
MLKLNISKDINISLGYTIIPILLTNIDKENLFDYVSRYIIIPDVYKTLLEQIEHNMKKNSLNMASITIEAKSDKSAKSIKKTKKNLSSSSQKNQSIHQIFLLAINNHGYNKSKYDELLEIARVSGNAIFNTLKSNQIAKINIVDTVDTVDTVDSNAKTNSGSTKIIEALLEGLLLSSYKFLKYKTNEALTKEKDKFSLSRINIVLSSYSKKIHHNDIHHRFKHLQNQIRSVFIARDLINEPANNEKSTTFINIVKQCIKDNKIPIKLEIFEKKDLEKLGMGLVLGVGSGSNVSNEPKVLIMKYDACNDTEKPAYVLLGKGITFDTGGLDIKGVRSMVEMKTDLSGAATVASFLLGYAMNKGSKCIYAICPFAENSVGPNSTKPSDVLKAYNGRTVEIANTDAEGRLILADCLAYTVDKYPDATIIDFATLTGQQESISCKLFSNVLSVNSKNEVAKLIESGKEINELLVELPIMEKQVKNLESYVADIKNVSFSCSADIIMSSLFMRQFIKKNTKWIHIDIAGPSYRANDVIKYASPEASGIGVRLLFAYFG